ncbi:MAG: HigA family addiction module antidote protein [Rubrivivax sp.]|nr:HigA family addiction module antidote protein [Rubrivivax sp.]
MAGLLPLRRRPGPGRRDRRLSLKSQHVRKVPYPRPGEILLEEFLRPMDISAYRLAKDIGVPQMRISEIIAGKRAITVDTGLRLSRYFGLNDGFWTGLQLDHDAAVAKDELADVLAGIKPLHAA